MRKNVRKWFVAVAAAFVLLACGKVYEEETPPNIFELPAGTEIFVRPADDFAPALMEEGEEFAGVLAKPLFHVREILEPDGETFERETLVAPEGAPVYGVVVADPEAEESERLGVELTSVTFHGGRSFPIETAPVFQFEVVEEDPAEAPPIREADVVPFVLTEPADVALVIEFRRDQEEKKKAGAE